MPNNTFPPTPRNLEFLKFLIEYFEANYCMPSYHEIKKGMSVKSNSVVHDHLTSLENRGYIERDYRKPRQIKLLRNLDGTSRLST